MPALKKKDDECPFAPDQVVKATKTFATDNHVVHIGEKYRGGDPVVKEAWTAFVDDETTLDSELPNLWNEMPAPPDHRPPVAPGSPLIPPHRQVRSTVDVWFDGGFAPGSAGRKSGRTHSGFGTAIRRGQIFDVGHAYVKAHPENFVFPERQVSLADVERLERASKGHVPEG